MATVMCCVAFAGCGAASSSAPSSTANSVAETESTPAATDEVVEIRFSWWGSEARHAATLAAIAAYEEANPGVKITPEYSGYDGYQDKLMAQVSGGNAPDIFTSVTEWYPGLYEADAMADITDKFDMSGHSDAIIEACSYNGKVYGVNVSLNGYGLYYNKTLAEKYGIEVPEGDYTWDDLAVMLGEAYEKSGGEVYGASDIRYAGWEMEAFGYAALQKPWPYMYDNDGLTITAEDVQKYYEYAASLPEGALLPPDESFSADSFTNAPIAQGRTMYEFNSIGTFNAVQSQTEDKLGVLKLPVGPNGETANSSRPGLILNLYSGSKAQDEAIKFLDWFTNSPEAAKILTVTRGVPPTAAQREALLENPDLLTEEDLIVIDVVNDIYAGDTLVFLPGPLGIDQVREKVFLNVSQEVAFGQLTPEEGSVKFIEEAEKTLAR